MLHHYHVPILQHQRRVHATRYIVESQYMQPQLSSAQPYLVQQRSVVPVLSIGRTAVPEMMQSTRYRYVRTYCVLVFFLPSVDCHLSVPMPPPPAYYTPPRPANQNVTSPS